MAVLGVAVLVYWFHIALDHAAKPFCRIGALSAIKLDDAKTQARHFDKNNLREVMRGSSCTTSLPIKPRMQEESPDC